MMITAAMSAVLAVGVAGCSDDAPDEPAGLTAGPTPTGTSSASPTGPSKADDVATIKQLYADYWDAVITAENGPNPDPALFDGIVTGDALESRVGRVQRMVDEEQRRYGKPKIGEVKVTVDGDTARAEACVDQRKWGVVVQGQTQPPFDDIEPGPIGVVTKRTKNGWIIVNYIPVDESSLTC
ncbi:hypothetical protein CLV30_11781 [Haloactinopolyspora alba]|uniref:Nuclear transport factor 2 family protein n=1 Tax=Haloactinopolyspora alba TaxID=648780 RepID=A0A2P8DRD4_9ACTN|nr:hypothetical protein [Haloactinopolyspora alba]PSK99778.1 hypothetical protein CLV30_11781 [Haloactinopolyspora alba]